MSFADICMELRNNPVNSTGYDVPPQFAFDYLALVRFHKIMRPCAASAVHKMRKAGLKNSVAKRLMLVFWERNREAFHLLAISSMISELGLGGNSPVTG